MSALLVDHIVPLRDGGLIFRQWLPERREDVISVDHEGMTVSAWLDRDCIETLHKLTDDLVPRLMNMRATKIHVSVSCNDVPSDLAVFIRDNSEWPRHGWIPDSKDQETVRLANEYQKLGWRVLLAVLHVVNRIVRWAYAERGQYWLREHDTEARMMMSRNNEFEARAKIDSSPWVRWCPPYQDTMLSSIFTGGLQHEDWLGLGRFLRSNRRPNLVAEILANAEALWSQGHNRAALIEGLTALEVAFGRFVQRPNPTALRPDFTDSGVATSAHLKSAAEHLGLTNSVKYLLPVIVPNLPQQHAICCSAIDARHNVVHNAQRNVQRAKARKYLWALRELINFLKSATLEETDPKSRP